MDEPVRDEINVLNECVKEEKRSSFFGGMIVGATIMFVLLGIVFLVKNNFFRQSSEPAHREEVSVNTDNPSDAEEEQSFVTDALVNKLLEAENIIDSVYYFDIPDNKTVSDYLMLGLVASLEDVYADYFPVQDLQAKFDQDDGIYYGIGCSVITDEETSLQEVVTVYTGSPAEKAGVMEGDLIYAVDGVSVYGLSQDETVAQIKGPEGSTITVTFIRNGEYVDLDITRGMVEFRLVDSDLFDDIGYIRIESFEGSAVNQFASALDDLKDQNAKALIIDLRNNGGGTLDSVLDIAETFMPRGLITYLETKDGNKQKYNCKGKNKIDIPVVMLVNGYTASASELLTGAVKDYEMGAVVGTTTYGKGIAQSTYVLSDGSAIKLTTEGYFTPNGINVHGTGIEPDYVVEFDSEAYYAEESVDNQLEKAKEVAKSLITK